MTCVIGLRHKNKVYLAGDSAGTSGDGSKMIVVEPKVFEVGEFMIGFANSFRSAQILRHMTAFTEVSKDDVKNLERYLVSEFIPVLKETLSENGVLPVVGGDDGEPSGEHNANITLLIGYKNKLFVMEQNYQVFEVKSFHAVGAGKDLALGSLHTTDKMKMDPEERLTLALEAASARNASVAPPFTILSNAL